MAGYSMKSKLINKILPFASILVLLIFNSECKKQPKCGCGKDVIFTLTNAQALIQYNEASNTIVFYPALSTGATYYFCNPSQWMDSIKKLNTSEYLLISGDVFYECNYLYQSGNYYYYIPPVYQVIVTSIKEDSYSKK